MPATSAVSTARHAQPGAVTGLVFLLLSCTILQRFGINLGSLTISIAFVAMYIVVAFALLQQRLEVAPERALAYVVCAIVAVASLVASKNFAPGLDDSSLSSLVLLLALHLPLAFRIAAPPNGTAGEHAPLKYFADIAFVIAIAGIVQFYAQFFIHADWLFDFSPYIPEPLRAPGEFNTLISVNEQYKSNGFFFREPSGFSYIVALGLIIEWLRYKRKVRIGTLGLALVLSYSGTGLLTLLVAMLVPFGWRMAMRILLIGVAGLLTYWLLGDALNLSFTVNRVQEFQAEGSSGYMRYVAPMRLVLENLHSTPWSFWLGHGPGAISRASQLWFEFHDPTWAKLLYEYGVLGFAAFVGLTVLMLRGSNMEVQIRAVILVHWLIMGGLLLKAECVAVTFAFYALYAAPAKSNINALAPPSPARALPWNAAWIHRVSSRA